MRKLVVALLVSLSASTAYAQSGVVIDSRNPEPLPPGVVYAVEGDELVLVDTNLTQPSELYVVELKLYERPEHDFAYRQLALIKGGTGKVYQSQTWIKPSESSDYVVVDSIVQVRDISYVRDPQLPELPIEQQPDVLATYGHIGTDPDSVSPYVQEKLAQGKRFMLGNIELVIYAPGSQSFTAEVTRISTAPPVLGPAAAGEPLQVPRVVERPQPVSEKLGWISGSL